MNLPDVEIGFAILEIGKATKHPTYSFFIDPFTTIVQGQLLLQGLIKKLILIDNNYSDLHTMLIMIISAALLMYLLDALII